MGIGYIFLILFISKSSSNARENSALLTISLLTKALPSHNAIPLLKLLTLVSIKYLLFGSTFLKNF